MRTLNLFRVLEIEFGAILPDLYLIPYGGSLTTASIPATTPVLAHDDSTDVRHSASTRHDVSINVHRNASARHDASAHHCADSRCHIGTCHKISVHHHINGPEQIRTIFR